jgi:L-asparaginase/Glu-tRNA(Gln) amidotransferase subunit D
VIGEFQSHEVMGFIRGHAAQQQVMLDKHDRRVLILHTGGTIGMFASENGYRPEKDRFNEFLRNYPYFCDEK